MADYDSLYERILEHLQMFHEHPNTAADPEGEAKVALDAIWGEIERMGIAEAILRSEQFMWLMAGSNHIASHLRSIRPAFDKWIEKGGKSWGQNG